MLPSGFKLSSESKIQLHPDYNSEKPYSTNIDAKEEIILDEVTQREAIRLQDVPKITGVSNPHKYIKSLIQREFIIIYEEVNDKYKPKTVTKIRLTKDFASTERLEKTITELESKHKQLDVILAYLQLVPIFEKDTLNDNGITKKELIDKGISESSLKTLIKKRCI